MRELEYSAREKKVHKITRDGLVERSLTTGEEVNVNNPGTDVPLEHEGRREADKKNLARKGRMRRLEHGKAEGRSFSGAGNTLDGRRQNAKYRAVRTVRTASVIAAASGASRERHEDENRNVSEDVAQSAGLAAEYAARAARERRRGRYGEREAEPERDRDEEHTGQEHQQDEEVSEEAEKRGREEVSDGSDLEPESSDERNGQKRREHDSEDRAGEAAEQKQEERRGEAAGQKQGERRGEAVGQNAERPEEMAGRQREQRPEETAGRQREQRKEEQIGRQDKRPEEQGRQKVEGRNGSADTRNMERKNDPQERRPERWRDGAEHRQKDHQMEDSAREHKVRYSERSVREETRAATGRGVVLSEAAGKRSAGLQDEAPGKNLSNSTMKLTGKRSDSPAGMQKERKGQGAKWQQKQRIRKSYAEAAREAAKGAKNKEKVLDSAGKVIRKVAETVTANKALIVVVLLLVLVFAMVGSLFSSCAGMFSGIESAVLSSCYLADSDAINRSELRYTELEADLREEIADTELHYTDYDEYIYEIGEIGHDPFVLMGYLSAVFGSFTYEQVEPELLRLFGLQYELRREVIWDTRTYTDAYGEEQSYDWWVLKTTLTVRPLEEIVAGSFSEESRKELYEVYMQTGGNRQCFRAPIEGWVDDVVSGYGYRIDPETGAKKLHRGIDIAVPEGTPIAAVQSGTVVYAGDLGDFGLCIMIEDEKGYSSKYAHCASISVEAGQKVQAGEVIAAVGNTGSSDTAHLHLEVMFDGEYLNPVYFVGK